jgi:peptide/nickel transport system permease protein
MKFISLLLKHKLAFCSFFLLLLLYLMVLCAGFISPYSPTDDEFRNYFYHPPKRFHFIDQNSHIHIRPFVFPVFIADRTNNLYSEGKPLCIRINDSSFNKEEFFIDSIKKTNIAPVIIKNSAGSIIATIDSLNETDANTGYFVGCYPASPYDFKKDTLYSIEYRNTETQQVKYTLSFKASEDPSPSASPIESAITLVDERNEPVTAYHYKVATYPIQFIVRGFEYHFPGSHTIHLFKPAGDGYIFLFGTDQHGRDIFSRTLYGGRISLTIGILGALLSTILGLIIGGISGYYGGKIDASIMRFVEILMSIPALYLILALRNTVPDEFGKIYIKINLVAQQLYHWKTSTLISTLLFTVIIICLACIIYYKQRRKAFSVYWALFMVLFLTILLEGDVLIGLCINIIKKIIPPSTPVSSQWVYFYIVVIISMIGWASMARIIRGMVLSIKEKDFVLAAKALGASGPYILRRHILPQTYRFAIIRATLLIPFYILSEIALSFLGLGIQEPDASWGNMLQYSQNIKVLYDFPWMLMPGLFLFITVLCFNFFGDYLSSSSQ